MDVTPSTVRSRAIVWLYLALSATGCATSTAPLSDPNSAKMDEQLFGLWDAQQFGASNKVAIEPTGSESQPGMMTITVYKYSSPHGDRTLLFQGFCTEL